MPRIRFAFSAAAALLLASVASADDGPGNDQVRLNNGGMIRGVVVESQPGVSVKVLVAGDKEPRVIPWAEVAGVDMGKFATVGVPPPAPAVAPPPTVVVVPPSPLAPPPGILVHIDSPVPVVLHSNTETTGMVATFGPRGGLAAVSLQTLRPLCASPCDEHVDVRHDINLSVGADGITESARFSLADRTGDVQLKVSPGTSSAYYGGIVLTALGAASVLTGVVFIALAPQTSSPSTSFASTSVAGQDSSGDFVTAGAITAGVGGAMLVGGIIAIVSGRTTVEVQGGAAPQTARAPRYWAGEF